METITLEKPAVFAGKRYLAGKEVSVKDQEILESAYKQAERESIRNKINKENACDEISMLGTTSDITQLIFSVLSTIVVSLSEKNSLDEVKSELTSYKKLCKDFLSDVEKGDVRLTHLEPRTTMEDVVAKFCSRTTNVQNVIEDFLS